MTGIDKQIREGMSTVGTACPVTGRPAPPEEGSIRGKLVLDLNRSPVAGGADGQDESPVAAGARASPVAVNLDLSLVAAGACVEDEAPIAADTRASPVVVDLDGSPVDGGGNVAPIAAGTRDSPIDVEALADEVCLLSVPLGQSQ